jgi:hypothetical protein
MDQLAVQLDRKLATWQPQTAAQVRERIAELMQLADQDLLDVVRSRDAEQEVLDLIDAPASR